MMDNRNSFAPRRDTVPGAAQNGPRFRRDRMNPSGGRFLALEPEDYDNGAVPIADPPAPEPRGISDYDDPEGEDNAPRGMSCGGGGALAGAPLAMAYTPDQAWRELYEDDEALSRGTLFRELDFPFCPGCGKNGR